MPNILRI